ncbi:asparagine synthase (glutamine-hydrolyzing) [Mucilaginibacter corticis]|uniref:asparagine synthase (glutamine-hydrolyzing) n=1 Tax=Mucilaginibacter corticis TaxID=2597670 RepID=A0A556M7Z2_9SPHI|nr:asparagine synthase (glutamine-hydrolyzing) [Mucilaginibacter corticis]TSJ35955.1 asparagine synthase (glutamine-hydrolyzing) [Mucilaginibacter corticis]
MCRIAGIIAKRISHHELTEKVSLMCDVLKHGGPDDGGIFSDEHVSLVFGHRRLSIIDPGINGHQPMADVNKRVWITFNGEIYNYLPIREQLLAVGVVFHSFTDTEVIINAYLQWGVSSFSKLRGMFAFALYDIKGGTTFLVRDASGVKPLYYYVNGKSLSFASEVRAFKSAGTTHETDHSWPVRFLAFGHIPEPFTTLKNVLSLQKGHYLAWQHDSCTYQIRPFYQITAKPGIISLEDAKAQIRAGLQTAVNRQLMADAPIGVFLSGGTDSSILSLLANQQTEQQIKTISIYFNEKNYDESAYQNNVLQQISGEKYTHLVKQKDFEEYFPKIIADMDLPTTDGINTWFISKYAHQDGLKAVLSGVGADELFGGYPSFNRMKYLRYLRKLPSFLFKAANYFQTDRHRKISFLANEHYLGDYLLLRGLFVASDIARILDRSAGEVNEILFSEQNLNHLNRYDEEHAAWFETNLYMQNQLLRDTDVMSMSHGLEVRVPFLDEDFQELALSLAPGIRFDSYQPKKILIDSFRDLLPEPTWNRPKMGFTFPFQEWMSRHGEISNEKLYKGRFAKNEVLKFKNGQIHWSKIFALYQIQQHV